MKTTDAALHSMRGHQLRALYKIIGFLPLVDGDAVARFFKAAGPDCDASRLTSKDHEEIATLCSRHFSQVGDYGN